MIPWPSGALTRGFGVLSCSPRYNSCSHISLILPHAENKFSNKNAHLSSSFSCWAMDLCSWTLYFNTKFLKIQVIFNYPFLSNLKLFYIENCLYIAVETLFNINCSIWKEYLPQFEINLRNFQFYEFSLLFFLKCWQPCSEKLPYDHIPSNKEWPFHELYGEITTELIFYLRGRM